MAVSHYNMWAIKSVFARSENEIVAWIKIGDSRSARRKWREPGAVARHWDVKHAALWMEGGTTANNGNEDGLGNFQIGLTGITSTFVNPGNNLPSAGYANRFPIPLLEVWTTSTPSNPHFNRYNIVYSTGGADMDTSHAGGSGGQFYRGDPAQGRNIQSVETFYVTDTRTGVWLPSQTEVGYSAAESGAGSGTFSAPSPGSSAGTITGFTVTMGSTTGTNIRVRQRHTGNPAIGTGFILAGTRINFGNSGIIHVPIALGGWRSAHLLPATVAGVGSNPDYSIDAANITEFYSKCIRADVCVIEIELGQNSPSGAFAEWNGNDTGRYKANLQLVTDIWRAAVAAGGAKEIIVLYTQHWSGGPTFDVRSDAYGADLRTLAVENGYCYYNQQNALEDAGQTSSRVMLAANRLADDGVSTDVVHQGFVGNGVLGATKWAAFQAATPADVAGFSARRRAARNIIMGDRF